MTEHVPEGSQAYSRDGLVRAAKRGTELVGLIALPAFYASGVLLVAAARGDLATDFVHFELPAAERLVRNGSPYPGFGYPPLVAFALVPFVWIPAAEVLVTSLLLVAVPSLLWIVGVRDWRCYGVAFLWSPVIHAIQTANVTLPMMFVLALAWRFRDSTIRPGALVGVATALKILAWPAGLWLLATRRVRSWLVACATTAVLTFGLWALIGFHGLAGYTSYLERSGKIDSGTSYTLTTLVADVGASRSVGRLVALAIVLIILVVCVVAGLRGQDRLSFALAVTACIYASPIVWLHSFAFLLVAVAVLSPRLSLPWLLPIPMLLASGNGNGEPWQTALVLACGLATIAAAAASFGRDGAGPGVRPVVVPRRASTAQLGRPR